MIERMGLTPLYQASFPVLDRLLWTLGALVGLFVVVFAIYVLVMATRRGPGTRARTIVGIVGSLLLLGLGLVIVFLALVLMVPRFFLAIIIAVLVCLGIAVWLLWRHLRGPR